jgi:hypothetical protein
VHAQPHEDSLKTIELPPLVVLGGCLVIPKSAQMVVGHPQEPSKGDQSPLLSFSSFILFFLKARQFGVSTLKYAHLSPCLVSKNFTRHCSCLVKKKMSVIISIEK